MRRGFAAFAAALAVTIGVVAATAAAASGPPPVKTFGGAKASPYATGLDNPTSFAWGDGVMFAGDSGNSTTGIPNGGVYVIRHGVGAKLPNSPVFVGGVAFRGGALYLSDVVVGAAGPSFQIAKWRGWNGSNFTKRQTIYTAPKGFQGFNGIAFGPDGRLYVGVDAGLLDNNDHGPASTSPYVYDILSMNTRGKAFKVVARGIRQPWQLAFAPGSSEPFVSDLGQDSGATNPPDFVLKVRQGDNYGFPNCNWTTGSKCKHSARPFKFFGPHTNIMGLATMGKTLFMGSFLGAGGRGSGALYEMPIAGGKVKSVVTGFPMATDALAAHGGALYIGGQTRSGAGLVYRVKP